MSLGAPDCPFKTLLSAFLRPYIDLTSAPYKGLLISYYTDLMISVPFGGQWSDCFYYSVTNKHLPYAGNTQSTVSFGAQSGKVGSKEEVTSLSAAVF